MDKEWLSCVNAGSLGSCRTTPTMQFISCSKCPAVAGDTDNQGVEGGGYACAGAGGKQEISETFLSNLCDPKTPPKYYVIKKGEGK